jgi:hypothetical protein
VTTDTVDPDRALPADERNVAAKIVEAIEAPEQWTGSGEDGGGLGGQLAATSSGTTSAGGYLPTMDLPGFGDPYDDCGEDIPHFCEHCGSTFPVGRTCRRSVCERCAQSWVVDRASSVVGKLDATARMMSAATGESIKKHHVVVSPPADWFLEADEPLDRTFHVIRDVLDALNAEGMVAYHPWSGGDDVVDDRGEWKRRLFNGREWSAVRSGLEKRPHFHCVVAAEHIPGGELTERVHRETGWVIHRIADESTGVSLGGLDDVARAVTYTLSHTGIDTDGDGPNQAAYRQYGSTLHDAEVFDDLAEQADVAVRSVAPRVLGVDPSDVRCTTEVAADDAPDRDDAVDLTAAADGDGSGDAEADAETTVDEVELVECSGRILTIDRAPEYLDDPEWRATASHVDELQTTWEAWDEGEGWDDLGPDAPPPD